MDWFKEIYESYLSERKQFLKDEWFTGKSWIGRLINSSRATEMSRLIIAEAQFNQRWFDTIEEKINEQENKQRSAKEALRLIETHIKKQNSRSFFLVVFGILLVGVFKFFGADFTILLVAFAFLLAGERLIVNETVSALEELKLMIEPHKETT